MRCSSPTSRRTRLTSNVFQCLATWVTVHSVKDPNSFPKAHSLIAAKVVLQTHIELRAFNISQSAHSGSALDNWLRADKELLVGAEGARVRYGLVLWPRCGTIASNGIGYGSGKIGGDSTGLSPALLSSPRSLAAMAEERSLLSG